MLRRAAGFPMMGPLTGVGALAGLAGCAPPYDWREVRVEGDRARVLLPGKPAKLSRPIDLDGKRVEMAMTGALVAGTAFTLAAAQLDEDTPQARARALIAMRTGMLRNIEGHIERLQEDTVRLIDAAGRARGRAPGERVEARGRMRQGGAHLLARFVAWGDRAWQCVVLGEKLEPEQAHTFLDSLVLVQT